MKLFEKYSLKYIMESKDELIFVLNTSELRDGGFDGSFNDLAEELENTGAVVSGDYDEEGNPVMTVFGIETEELNDMLSSYGIEKPEEFTAEVESGDSFDFDDETDAEDDDEVIEVIDDDDEEDDEEEVIEIDDDEISESLAELRAKSRRASRPSRMNRNVINESEKNEKKVVKGTQNLSESVTLQILNEVKDNAIVKRIMESVKRDAKVEGYVAPLPYSGIKVNGKELIMESKESVEMMLKDAKDNYKKYYKKYKSLNESASDDADKYKKALRKQHKLIKLLEGYIAFQDGKIFEEEEVNMTPDTTSNDDVPVDTNKELGDQVATLTSIVFKVKNADDFIKTLVDNGIPEEALEKTDTTEDVTGSDAEPQDETQQPDAQQPMGGAPQPMGGDAMGGAPAGGGNPFESLTTRLSNKLNEDENPFGDQDQPSTDSGVDPLSTESHDNAPEGEEVRLVDTSYASKVQQILQDVYGYSKEQFEDKLGGQLEDEETTESDDSSDETGTEEVDTEKEGTEEEIRPEDVFGDIEI